MRNITRLCIDGPMSGQFIESQEDKAFYVDIEGCGVLRYEPKTFRVESRRDGLNDYNVFVSGKETSSTEVVVMLSKAINPDDLIEYLKNARV